MKHTSQRLTLNSVSAVFATAEPGVYVVQCNITDVHGENYDTNYYTRASDEFGLNPTIRQWLTDNSSFPIQPYAPPTAEEVRASLPPLSARQFRLGLANAGISSMRVTAAIDAMPVGLEKERAQIDWEYATTFSRSQHLIAMIGTILGLSDERIDVIWQNSLDS
ncbi:MAG: hypothetical protein KK478_19605 [Ensifer alkalisoli]|nr:hypothetical protein [Sinorhizobium alkalisoli]